MNKHPDPVSITLFQRVSYQHCCALDVCLPHLVTNLTTLLTFQHKLGAHLTKTADTDAIQASCENRAAIQTRQICAEGVLQWHPHPGTVAIPRTEDALSQPRRRFCSAL